MRFDSDRIMSITALMVGVGSLFIIVYQTQLIRESERASVMPYLMVAMQANTQSVYLQLRNNGIGPALIENVQVVKQDDVFEGDAFDYFVTLDPAVGYNQLG